MERPILPARLALDLLGEVQAFVAATLYVRDATTREAIMQCLFSDNPMVKGPFLQVRLPYRSTEAADWPLHYSLKLPYLPYAHQLNAWSRLSREPSLPTLVTTGTGSGKTECFLLPILNYVIAQKEAGKNNGMKALILYPMNALIDDQGERLAELANKVNQVLGFEGEQAIRIGRYTGGGGSTREMNPDAPNQVIDSREALCSLPPDILLTNYKMLDFMLYRPEEQSFWGPATQDAFRFLVLDELHTFDGAQGADVACLIRRFRLKLAGKSFCSIGTSATIAGGNVSELCNFATKLFGEQFTPECVVSENILSKQEALKEVNTTLTRQPKSVVALPPLVGASTEGYAAYLAALQMRWGTPTDPEEAGRWLLSHPLLHGLLDANGSWESVEEAAARCSVTPAILCEFVDLVAWARRGNRQPLFRIQCQVWGQESRRLGRELSKTPKFVRMVDGLGNDETNFAHVLPAVNCSDCGAAGWVTQFIGEWDANNSLGLIFDRRIIINAYMRNKAHILFPRPEKSELDGSEVHYSRVTGRLHRGCPEESTENSIQLVYRFQANADDRVFAVKKNQVSERPVRCPECDKKLSLRMSAVSGSLLTSVMSGAFLSHPANPDDRKLLIFNDSIQDAAHQAGYVSHRSFRFGLRRFVASLVRESGAKEKTNLRMLRQYLRKEILDLCHRAEDDSSAERHEARMRLATLIPIDLWQRFEHSGETQRFFTQEVAEKISDRLSWETWFELTINSSLGWSLRKTGQAGVEPLEEVVEIWIQALEQTILRHPEAAHISDKEAFIQGILRRFVELGAVYHEDLAGCYAASNFSLWPIRNSKSHLRALFGFGTSLPGVVSLRSGQERKERGEREGMTWVLSSKGTATWFEQWGKRHNLKKPGAFFIAFFECVLQHEKSGLIRVRDEGAGDFVISDEILDVRKDGYTIFRCTHCAHLEAIAFDKSNVKLTCTQYRCQGELKPAAQEADAFRTYMGRYYNRPLVGTWAHAHTGQLAATDRRRVEDAFKEKRLPGDKVPRGKRVQVFKQHPINILACTPTMEMGIDIGDLSAVFLRSFPRSIANANQRLGRSGRKTGNAINVAVTKLVPHDLHYWNDPMALLQGRVNTPGCEFTNRQMLWRQFNAYCLDTYSLQADCPALPKPSLEDPVPLIQHPFWQNFRAYLKEQSPALLAPFLDTVFANHPDGTSYKRMKELDEYFTDAIKQELLWLTISKALTRIDEKIAARRKHAIEAQPLGNESEKNLETQQPNAFVNDNIESQKILERADEKEGEHVRLSKAWEKLGDETYILSMLGDEGVLPNYAFPETGIQLEATIRLPAEKKEGAGPQKASYKNVSISRPPLQGLRELAPGQTYYLDGFKIPIVRIDTVPQNNATRKVFCRECGQTTNLKQGDTEQDLDIQVHDCQHCGAEEQPVVSVVDFNVAVGRREFDRAQIRDNEDEREKNSSFVETYINYLDGDAKEHASWVSDEELIGVEFRTKATITFANLNSADSFETPRGFEVCSSCGAIPSHKIENGETVTEFRGKSTENVNRHKFTCQHFSSPNNAPTGRIGLYHDFKSDVLRFTASHRDEVPSLVALLDLSMRLLLGGQPGHIETIHSELKTLGRGYRHIITLFDNVPGGSGHLLSLMSFTKSDGKGLSELRTLFKKTLRKLKDCACTNGCYECLLTYDNQYLHDQIYKPMAISWIERFLGAKDWKVPTRTLVSETRENSAFDGYAEEFLIDGLLGSKNGNFGISGLEYFRLVKGTDGQIYEMGGSKLEHTLFIEATGTRKVSLDGSVAPYTKPDFWIYRSEKSNPENKILVAYLYVDGRDAHIGAGDTDAKIFRRDIALRQQLQKESGLRVITITYQMIEAWLNLRKNGSIKKHVQTKDKPLHLLNAWLFSALLPSISRQIQNVRYEELVLQLLAGFVSGVFEDLLDPKTDWFDENDDKYFEAATLKLSEEHQSARCGNIFWSKTTKGIVLDASPEARLAGTQRISSEFSRDWSLWWIIKQLSMKRSSRTCDVQFDR